MLFQSHSPDGLFIDLLIYLEMTQQFSIPLAVSYIQNFNPKKNE